MTDNLTISLKVENQELRDHVRSLLARLVAAEAVSEKRLARIKELYKGNVRLRRISSEGSVEQQALQQRISRQTKLLDDLRRTVDRQEAELEAHRIDAYDFAQAIAAAIYLASALDDEKLGQGARAALEEFRATLRAKR